MEHGLPSTKEDVVRFLARLRALSLTMLQHSVPRQERVDTIKHLQGTLALDPVEERPPTVQAPRQPLQREHAEPRFKGAKR